MNYFKTLRKLSALRSNNRLTHAQMKNLQDKKLRQLLHYVWDNSTFYRRSFEDAGIRKEQLESLPLSEFPTIDKKILTEHFDKIVTTPDLLQEELHRFDEQTETNRKPYLGKYHVVHSSGSTGKPVYFVYDESAWNTMLTGIVRGALWNMSMPQIFKLLAARPRIIYIAATDGRYGGAMAVGDGIDGIGARQMYLDIKTPMENWIESVSEFDPDIIIGYPSAIKILAELVKEGQVRATIKRVISCGEPLNGGMRSFLEQTFSCPVINIYGAGESLALGVETGTEGGMLLFDDLNIIEIENGVMYLTCLYNFAQPLIRYRISDRLSLKEPLADSPFTRAEILLGRSEDILWFENRNGQRDFLHPLAVEGFCIEGLLDYQFRQLSDDAFEIHLQVSSQDKRKFVADKMAKLMRDVLREKNLNFVRFDILLVEEILPDPKTGKKPLIVTSEKKDNLQKEAAV